MEIMTTREEAASGFNSRRFAAAYAIKDTLVTPNAWERVDAVLAAADAHDAKHGIHRINLGDEAVERAARALFTADNPEADWEELPLNQWVHDIYRQLTRAVIDALKEQQA